MDEHKPLQKERFGSRLEHGCAHAVEHATWSRRDFMAGMGLMAGATVMAGATPVHTLVPSPFLEELRHVSTDRILVLVQLVGGNDGLNTIIPVEDDVYFRSRPRLAIPKHVALPLTDTLGMHPALQPLTGMYGDGRMAIVQNVGYPSANLSHFRSKDIWMSASDSDVYDQTGWIGRQLEKAHRNFATEPTPYPLAVQIGGVSSGLFRGNTRVMGMSVSNVRVFDRLVRTGRLYDVENIPDTVYGREIEYLRTVANDAFRYGGAVQEASEEGRNEASYPEYNKLAGHLSLVARLIKGNLGSRVYHVEIGGFDTHSTQGATLGTHATLLQYLAEGVTAFVRDLEAGSRDREVLVMTYSEFGRRVRENGSRGTDHGTSAPLFFFGPGVSGGLFGETPSLVNLDDHGNLRHATDFRAVYATVLQHWFGFSAAASEDVLGYSYDPLGFVGDPLDVVTSVEEERGVPTAFSLDQNYPNPFNASTSIGYSLSETRSVRLQVFDIQGRLVRTLVDRVQSAGQHTARFDTADLPSGTYFYRLHVSAQSQSRQMTLVR